MATIERRKTKDGETRFHVRVRLAGYPTHTASFRKRRDAERWAAKIETDLREGRAFGPQATRLTVREALAYYVEHHVPRLSDYEQRHHRQRCAWWTERLGRYRVQALRPALVTAALSELQVGPSTRNKYSRTLSRALTIARRAGLVVANPLERQIEPAPEPRGRVRFLDESERVRLLEAVDRGGDARLPLIVRLALGTGARQAEIMGLRVRDVDLERRLLSFVDTKNGTSRSVSIPIYCLELLRRRLERFSRGADRIFRYGRHAHFPRKAWERALRESEVEDFRFHDLRHTCASYLAQSGATLREIAEVLGHRTLQMVQRYSHLTLEHSAAVLDRMNSRLTMPRSGEDE